MGQYRSWYEYFRFENNYGEIKVQLNNKTVNTGRLLLGSIIGDHSKTSINTMLNTGTIVGVLQIYLGQISQVKI